jgi:hypothetical protein
MPTSTAPTLDATLTRLGRRRRNRPFEVIIRDEGFAKLTTIDLGTVLTDAQVAELEHAFWTWKRKGRKGFDLEGYAAVVAQRVADGSPDYATSRMLSH